jgi:predicted RNA binding protein YcfA (HicA-like mRNA interferase family)
LSLRNHGYQEVIKILSKHFGFSPVRQKGSHIILEHPDGRFTVVPAHNPIKLGTMRDILSQASISEEDFLKHV